MRLASLRKSLVSTTNSKTLFFSDEIETISYKTGMNKGGLLQYRLNIAMHHLAQQILILQSFEYDTSVVFDLANE